MIRQNQVLGIVFLVIGAANMAFLSYRAWGLGSGAVFVILGIVFLRRARLEQG